tara:strand:+ start:28 stop:405 length:378 start_codon:yes stop_codon:yes gene_type:complete
MNKQDKHIMYKNIHKHGENLNNIFRTNHDPVKLCKQLRRLENKAHQLSTDYCNGVIDCETWDKKTKSILNKLIEIFNLKDDFNIFVNSDARGYALKIFPDFVHDRKIYKDWGDNGIIAPDFTPYY